MHSSGSGPPTLQRNDEARPALVKLLWVQGLYFLVTGVWPLVDIDSFQIVTGPKTDLWLVRTVGVLIAVIALSLISAALAQRVNREVFILGVGSAIALAAIDIIYVSLEVIAKIYLADAVVEGLIIAAWLSLFRLGDRQTVEVRA